MRYLLFVIFVMLIVGSSTAQEVIPQADLVPLPEKTLADQIKQNEIYVYVIDMSGDNQVSADSALHEQDAILVYRMPDFRAIRDPNLSQVNIITPETALDKMDIVKDGSINSLDPSFADMYLLVFSNKGKKYRLISAYDAGLRAIFLSQKEMQLYPENQPTGFLTVANHVIMADSKERMIRLVKVPKAMFKNLMPASEEEAETIKPLSRM